jgi:hypothetical protein
MWEQYRKTFVGMQLVILLVSASTFFLFGRQATLAGTFFGTMQVAALMGAYWGDRLRKRMHGRA